MTRSPAARAACSTACKRRDRGLEQADVVAERLAEAAGLEKVALHVDDEKRRALERDGKRLRLGGDQGFHGPSFSARLAAPKCDRTPP